MLQIAAPLILLVCMVQTAYAQDNRSDTKALPEAGLCKPVCVSVRQDCRAHVPQATDNDTNPVLSMKQSSNPYAAASRETGAQSQQLRPTEAQAFRARRAERLQACDVQYRSCTRACG